MDFFNLVTTKSKKDGYVLKAVPIVGCHSDLMIRGNRFYAIWDEENNIWTKSLARVCEIIDKALYDEKMEVAKTTDQEITVLSYKMYDNGQWQKFINYLSNSPDSFQELDRTVLFLDDSICKNDYASFTLSYPLINQPCPNYMKLMETLYDPEERQKLEWAIGAIFVGDSRSIQKFVVLYGDAGSGKSTFIKIVQMLFEGYCKAVETKALGMASDQFSMEPLRDNPLVAIQDDADLSRIEDNTKLNSIISHEKMIMREKHKSAYEIKLDTFLIVGSNSPVRITDAKSGLTRRLLDVVPSGRRLDIDEYDHVMSQIPFELSGIAWHCIEAYRALGKHYYDRYVPVSMMLATDPFYNFVESNYFEFKDLEYLSLDRAWEMYKQYCEESGTYRIKRTSVRDQLKSYFREFYETKKFPDGQKRKVYMGFKTEKFITEGSLDDKVDSDADLVSYVERLEFNSTDSEIDILLANCPAQYASNNENQVPLRKWENVTTTLKDLDTTKVHYIFFPEEYKNHVVVDFDLKDSEGNKSAELNLEAAAKWPATYAEFSKSGAGIHLHYIYDGDASKLSSFYAPGIEIKVFNGKSSLRRRLSYCNELPVAHLSSGLPLKEEKKVVNFSRISSEKSLREMIERNLRKEIHPATKPSIDFIYKILEDAYNDGNLIYDIRDMRPKVLAFAANSSHQSDYCVRLVAKMRFCSENAGEVTESNEEEPLVFFDLEVFPNLLIVCWKYQGADKEVVRMINPSPSEIGKLMEFKLVGFNNRRYDNHILYARYIGWDNEALYRLSQKLIGNSENATFREAYNISYADIYEFSAKKQSLKKFEIELDIHHQENAYPWDEPLAKEHWSEVTDYCVNDVLATEAVFNARYSDFVAQEILADLTGMPVNSNGNSMAARLIFGNNRQPELVYVDLATGEASNPKYKKSDVINAFPGYEFKYDPETKKPVNMYRGTDVGFGGYVYAEPGMYTNVALIDVASMHPHSAIAMNYFGAYTKIFEDLVQARIHIKHEEYDKIRVLFDGRLNKYLNDESKIGDLAYSLKIVINKIYGLTSAKFENEFRDSRNKNNIVALRGALFMRTLQDEVVSRGFKVAHIKTDSIKIPNATPEIIQFCLNFAKRYGYTFEHEATYDRMCLVNNAVYIAKYMSSEQCQSMYGYVPGNNKKYAGKWTPTGAQFAHPFVFKTLFSKEPIEFKDLRETKEVKSSIYMDFNEDLPDVSGFEDELTRRLKDKDAKLYLDMSNEQLEQEIKKGHNYRFVGRIGLFTPVISGSGGALVMAKRDNKYSSVNGTKGYRWLESEIVQNSHMEDRVDMRYYRALIDDAIDNIRAYGDFEWFANSDDPPSESNHPVEDPNDVPWLMPCHDLNKTVCEDCDERYVCPFLGKEVI